MRTTMTMIALALLAGCGTSGGGAAGGAEAIRLGDGLAMVPAGEDASGCRQYRMAAEGRAAVQAIFYRTAAGDFTTIRREAACGG